MPSDLVVKCPYLALSGSLASLNMIKEGVDFFFSFGRFASLWCLSKLDQYFQSLFVGGQLVRATVGRFAKKLRHQTTQTGFPIFSSCILLLKHTFFEELYGFMCMASLK